MSRPTHHVNDVLFSRDQIETRVTEIVGEIAAGYRQNPLVFIGILRGSFVFLADLLRGLYRHRVPAVVDFLTLESYGVGTESSGQVRLAKDFEIDVTGQSVLIVDDILDSGRTLKYAVDHVKKRGAADVRTCVLLDKASRRVAPFSADYRGFDIDDLFVVGYGLDYAGRYRELPHIAKVTFEETPCRPHAEPASRKTESGD